MTFLFALGFAFVILNILADLLYEGNSFHVKWTVILLSGWVISLAYTLHNEKIAHQEEIAKYIEVEDVSDDS